MTEFGELSLIIVIAAGVATIIHILRQPLIIGHIITGLIVGPYVLNFTASQGILQVFSELGIALLLFIVGLNLTPKVIREVGKAAITTGIGQIVFTSAAGFAITHYLFGFNAISSLYIAIAITFSSTIIILKLLSDKGDLQKVYAKISVGFLLVQDIMAAIALIAITSFSAGGTVGSIAITLLVKGTLLFIALFIIAKHILPRLGNFFARSQEFLFLFSAAWGLGIAMLFKGVGFSFEIGALAAGVALSISPYHYEISAKMRPLRDFFIILFFILLGSQMAVGNIQELIVPAIILSIFVLIGNPLIVMVLMGLLRYNKKTGFLAGLTVAQISEFSLIIVLLGVQSGHIPQDVLSLVTLIGLITIAASSYLILYGDKIYGWIGKYLSVFERKRLNHELPHERKHDIILFGYNRIGYDLVQMFERLRKTFLIVDFNPDVIQHLVRKKKNALYGDASDSEFLDDLVLEKTKLVVSTVPDFETNAFLIKKVRDSNKKTVIMVVSHSTKDAERFYDVGASYVIMPHYLGGKYAANMIKRLGFKGGEYRSEKARHLKTLAKRKKIGNDHSLALSNH